MEDMDGMEQETNDTPSSQRNVFGIMGLIVSILGLVICLLSLPGLILSIIGLQREPKTAAIIGTILGVIGMLMAPLWIGLILPGKSTQETARAHTAQSYVNLLKIESQHHHTTTDTWPQSMDALDSKEVLIKKDPWGNDYRFKGHGGAPPVISSAGPDGLHDTADDIVPKSSSYR